MKLRLLLSLFCATLLGGASCSAAQALSLPDLVIPDQNDSRQPTLVDLFIEVTITGNLAETVLNLTYYNEGTRNAEGEFSLKLPEGATVSSYALDVNGKMRPGVAVEKAQAKHAYETIKRRNIDPGIVERQADNVYRTRIFPIFPKKHKRVRIGFTHSLVDGVYHFPFAKQINVKSLAITMNGEWVGPPTLTLAGNLVGASESSEHKHTWQIENAQLNNGSLTATAVTANLVKPIIFFQRDKSGDTHLVCQAVAENKSVQPENWSTFRIVWDASLSSGRADQEKRYAAIKKILNFASATEVAVHLLRGELTDARTFPVDSDADIDQLITYLKSTAYHGIANFKALTGHQGKTLLLSDGEAILPTWAPVAGHSCGDLYLCHSSFDKVSPTLVDIARETLAIDTDLWWTTFLSGSGHRLRTNLPRQHWIYSDEGENRFTIYAKIPFTWLYRFEMSLGEGRSNIAKIRNVDHRTEWGLARRLWAEKKLASLERYASQREITDFAISERLVSDYTSVIVLERFQDHITYRIPPPEPDLLQKYKQAIAKELDSTKGFNTEAWTRKHNWSQLPVYWFDFDLRDELRTVGMWAHASRTAFPADKLNAESILAYETWYEDAAQTILRRDQISSGEQMRDWLKEIDTHLQSLQNIRNEKANVSPDGQVHVSVRGRTRTRGIMSQEPAFSLRSAITQAGGTQGWDDLGRVYLYRDARRTGYNMLSQDYLPVPLEWGDMIVVEGAPDRYYGRGGGPIDPFAEPSPNRSSFLLSNQPAILEEEESTSRQSDPFGGSTFGWGSNDPFGQQTSIVKTQRSYRGQQRFGRGLPENFFEQIKTHPDASSYLNEIYSNGGGFSENDLVSTAQILNQRDQTQLALEILEQVYEVVADPLLATRIIAYWQAEFGDSDGAAERLRNVLPLAADRPADLALLHFDIAQITQSAEHCRQAVDIAQATDGLGELFSIALTDLYSLDSEAKLSGIPQEKLTADVRVVVTGLEQPYQLSVSVPEKYLSVADPNAHYEASILGVSEHIISKGMPGINEVFLTDAAPGTYHIRITKNLGRQGGEKIILNQTILIRQGASDPYKAGQADLSWDDIEIDIPDRFQPAPEPTDTWQEPDPFGQ